MATQPTCEERIDEELAYEITTMRDTLKLLESENEEEREDALDQRDSRPLEVATKRVIKILLSTGGPADWFEVTVDEDGDPTRVEYIFQDWFDGARREVTGDEQDTALAYLAPFVEYAIERDGLRNAS